MTSSPPNLVRLCRNTGAERLQHCQTNAQNQALFSTPMSLGIGSLPVRGAAALAAALTLSSVPNVAEAQQQRPAPAPPPVQGLYASSSGATEYATPGGEIRFVFDRSGPRAALVRFANDPEVHVLRPATMAAGGGEIYRTEDGSVMLRVTPNGGITIYTRTLRTGAAASEVSPVAPLTPEAVAFAEMQQRFRALQARARRSVGETVTFTVPSQMNAPTAGVVVDAAERAAEGLAEAPMTNVRRVVISLGRAPAIARRGDTLFIQVAPQMGYAGRPSSNTVRNVVMGEVQGPSQ